MIMADIDKDMHQDNIDADSSAAENRAGTQAADETDDHANDAAASADGTASGSESQSTASDGGDAAECGGKADQDGRAGSTDSKSDKAESAAHESAEELDGADNKSDADADGSGQDSSDARDAGTGTGKPDRKDKQIQELNDKYVRLFAEFDNYRKRTETEKLGMFAEGEKTVLLKVLPLIDNFERALQSIPEEQQGTALAEGIEKTYSSFMSQLTELGVTAIEAKDKPFDANLHNAVMHIEDDSIPENTVVEEFQRGYMFKDKVLRYSMVKVAN